MNKAKFEQVDSVGLKHFSYCSTYRLLFSLLICSLFLSEVCYGVVSARTRTRSKRHPRTIKHHQPSKEEEQAAKEAAARLALETRLIEGRNTILARAYRLYDSGTSESLQGNYKYSILQLKLAEELLKEHGQLNCSLAISTLSALAFSAQASKDYPLAKSSYEKLLDIRPQDAQVLLSLAKLEASKSKFNEANNYINRLLTFNPENTEAKLLADFVNTKLKAPKR